MVPIYSVDGPGLRQWRIPGIGIADAQLSAATRQPTATTSQSSQSRKRSAHETPATQPQSAASEAWKEFTPTPADHGKCLARVWSGGRGGQCNFAKLPGKDLCSRHEKESAGDAGLQYGLVTGVVPDAALTKFQQKKRQRKDVELAAWVCQSGQFDCKSCHIFKIVSILVNVNKMNMSLSPCVTSLVHVQNLSAATCPPVFV